MIKIFGDLNLKSKLCELYSFEIADLTFKSVKSVYADLVKERLNNGVAIDFDITHLYLPEYEIGGDDEKRTIILITPFGITQELIILKKNSVENKAFHGKNKKLKV